mmetsp:Transcript_18990/g.31494  ORF Transcript_18990/g.31494 Transcript_18990/m.31494 type:complete len:491 (+) Transcript_18990:148-1620(+)|eukprot:CAMPEP_0119004262 /NCGR_PEP_ID=MMETSP1176-20130426/1045_1 /TAXON_ID=265551 /ORGANISM="Synedropsis recta cf, Strain CCMP1620" /LENGTH=490 /DNA_ID=CAMNT_0006955947 /DNA_START=136 /DNA_END=1608 /DNA_ORIENTATION=+
MQNSHIMLLLVAACVVFMMLNISRSGGLAIYPADPPSDGLLQQVQQQREKIDLLVAEVKGLTSKLDSKSTGESSSSISISKHSSEQSQEDSTQLALSAITSRLKLLENEQGNRTLPSIDETQRNHLKDTTARLHRLENQQETMLKHLNQTKEQSIRHLKHGGEKKALISPTSKAHVSPTARGSTVVTTSLRSKKEDAKVIHSTTADSPVLPRPTAKGTVVTAYFEISSKHKVQDYLAWMSYMLSIDDPMVVFTTPEWVDRVKGFRTHAANRTVIITTQLEDLPIATDFNASLWKHQFQIDPIGKYRKTFKLYWIWLSKTYFLTEAIRLNPFESTHFVWTDIGCFRSKNLLSVFANTTMIQHVERIPNDSMLFMAHTLPDAPDDPWFSNSGSTQFFTSGSMMAGTKETILRYHKLFMRTIQEYLDRDRFVGEDQIILQSTCLQHHICEYVNRHEVRPPDTPYFGLRTVLLFGGDHYKYWKPPNRTKIILSP